MIALKYEMNHSAFIQQVDNSVLLIDGPFVTSQIAFSNENSDINHYLKLPLRKTMMGKKK